MTQHTSTVLADQFLLVLAHQFLQSIGRPTLIRTWSDHISHTSTTVVLRCYASLQQSVCLSFRVLRAACVSAQNCLHNFFHFLLSNNTWGADGITHSYLQSSTESRVTSRHCPEANLNIPGLLVGGVAAGSGADDLGGLARSCLGTTPADRAFRSAVCATFHAHLPRTLPKSPFTVARKPRRLRRGRLVLGSGRPVRSGNWSAWLNEACSQRARRVLAPEFRQLESAHRHMATIETALLLHHTDILT